MDNRGNIIAPLVVKPVNNHDNILFPESLNNLLETADLLNLDIEGSRLTLDSGFDSEANRVMIRWHNLVPVIRPNIRGTKDSEKIEKMMSEFDEAAYKKRHGIERNFAWEDTYKKLVIRYEKLKVIHLGFKYLAYSMVNLRETIKSIS